MNLTFNTLLPAITGLILGLALLGYLFYHKGSEISIGRIVVWLFWTFLLYAIMGVIAIKIEVLPYSFTMLSAGSILLGVLYVILAPLTFDWWSKSSLTDIFLTAFILMFFGIAGFSLLYNILSVNPIAIYSLLVATLGFLVPSLVIKAYEYWMYVPQKQYKTWAFPVHAPVPRLQPIDPIKLMMNFTPLPSGKNGQFESYEVEFPTNESLSNLFHYFISFHNKHREYRKRPIQYLEGDTPLQWVLYKYSPQKKKVYLDMDKTLIENEVSANEHIYALSSE